MLYWLFTSGRAFLQQLFLPTLCLSAVLLPLALSLFGIGIQRRLDGQPLDRRDAQGIATLGRWILFVAPNLILLTGYVWLLGGLAVGQATTRQKPLQGILALFVGASITVNQGRLIQVGLGLLGALFLMNIALWQGIKNGGWLREQLDRLRRPTYRRGEMGSAHFCTMREFRRFRQPDGDGITFLGAFWGERRQRVDFGWGRFALSAEDAARGVLTFGSPGSGKTQCVILPATADHMLAQHSLIVADPQGELQAHIRRFATATRHLVVVHDPTDDSTVRYNLASSIRTVSDARAVADVLIPSKEGDNKFWIDSAAALLAACLIRFDTLGDIYNALNDLKTLAHTLGKTKDDAALLANSFIASVNADGKVAASVVATLATALTGWASGDVRKNTHASDFDAELIVSRPVVVILTCPGRVRDVYAFYLGATLRKLMLDLDTIGERNHGPLPVPVGIILDEFPTLGKLDSLVADVNLVRKRRISILIGAQSKSQFHIHYGESGTQALLTGLATQIVYGGCDTDTATFYSRASGIATSDTDPDPAKASYRQRPLLTMDEIVAPEDGNCTIFARYVEPNYAGQVVFHAQLTRMYQRLDWQELLQASASRPLNLLTRGIDIERLAPPEMIPKSEFTLSNEDEDEDVDSDDGIEAKIDAVSQGFEREATQKLNALAAQMALNRKSAELGVQFTDFTRLVEKRRAKLSQPMDERRQA